MIKDDWRLSLVRAELEIISSKLNTIAKPEKGTPGNEEKSAIAHVEKPTMRMVVKTNLQRVVKP